MIKTLEKISRKRYIQCLMTVLLTGIILYFTSVLWLSRVVIVSFNSESDSEITYKIFYTENDKQEFIKERSVSSEVKVGQHDVEIILPADNLYKLRVDIINHAKKVIISDFLLEGNKIIKPDLSRVFMNGISKYEVKGDDVIIKSTEEKKKFVLKERFDLLGMPHIDWCRLIIISVLSFLLMYKFVQYLSRFKIEKQHSRIDIVMLAVFFALLFVPMSHISDAEQSEQENRMLAKKPQLMIDSRGGGNYGVQFDAWYNDHFFGRDAMIKIYGYIKFKIKSIIENDIAMVGDNGFLYTKKFNSIKMYQNDNLFTTDELKTISDSMEKFVKDAKAVGVKNIYFLLSNDKESMYPEFYPKHIGKTDNISRLEQLLQYVDKYNKNVKVFNFKKEFDKIKDEEIVYCKTGTHMNSIGAYYEYYFLMNEIKKDYPEVNVLTLDDFNMKDGYDCDDDLYTSLGSIPSFSKYYSKDNFKNKILHLKQHNAKKIKFSNLENIQHFQKISKNNKSKGGLKFLIMGDSFVGRYFTYLAESFYNTHYIYSGLSVGKFMYTDSEIKDIYNNIPDIIVVEATERGLDRLLTLVFPHRANKEN